MSAAGGHRTHAVPRPDLAVNVHTWGDPQSPAILLLHGWADCGASFEFLARALDDRHYLVAPDHRGFGDSGWAPGGYWFPDYLGDVDAVVRALLPDRRFALVGHSMGGNIAGLYAGIRPELLTHLALLEGFGLPDMPAEKAPDRYRHWLDQLAQPETLREFADDAAIVRHIRKLAPHARDEVVAFVAGAWTRATDHGTYALKMDPAHKRLNPVLYRRAESLACWQRIPVPILLVAGEESDQPARFPQFGTLDQIAQQFPRHELQRIARAGHMMHIDQPEEVAARLGAFLAP
jgi:pimeloyl-ACP methyl ester carboxylesterase